MNHPAGILNGTVGNLRPLFRFPGRMRSVDPQKLALFGGPPVFPAGPPGWPRDDMDVREALLEAWRDGSWGRYDGPHGQQLVAELSERHAVEHVSLICSGTMAVELALRAVSVEAGDHVVLAGYDFPGNFRAVEAIGAWPVLVDISPASFAPTAEIIEAALRDSPPALGQSESKVKAIVVSHLHGGLADIPAIVEAARRHGTAVVEDACQATGAMIDGQRVGGLADVGVLSFGGSKLLTAGRGGAILTNDERIWQRAKVFGQRGNETFPLSELQAAVLLPQLRRLEKDNRLRERNTRRLRAACQNLPGLRPLDLPGRPWQPSYYKLAWTFDGSRSDWTSRERILQALQSEGVSVGEGFRGFTRRTSRRCTKVGDLSECVAASENTLLLHHPVLLESASVVDRLASAFRKVACAAPTTHG